MQDLYHPADRHEDPVQVGLTKNRFQPDNSKDFELAFLSVKEMWAGVA